MGPSALRAAGLAERLRASGLDIRDLGDLPVVRFRPNPEYPKQQNAELVLDVAREVAELVGQAMDDGRVPLVLGGDCSISLGVIAGLLRHRPHLGLLYLDADLDLNTPETTLSGILDGMVLAHLLGRGVPELAAAGPRRPMLSESDVVLFGYDLESGAVDPYEIEVLGESEMASYSLPAVRADPVGSSRAAVLEFGGDFDGFVVHFDVDVTNLRCVDVPHPGGLEVESAFQALEVLVQAPKCAAVVVTEFNAELDPDGSEAERLVEGLVGAFSP
jgi:arginase